MPNFSFIDYLILEIDGAVRTLHPLATRACDRLSPSKFKDEGLLTPSEKKHVAGLMRVNHTGEVCAQALYRAHALTARTPKIAQQMQEAACEENDHLSWCEQRLQALGSQPSVFNGGWYVGAFLIGAFSGLFGDRVSLGFVAETEKQVAAHLERHLAKLPESDQKTRAILLQMHEDESRHGRMARDAGGMPLHPLIQWVMGCSSKLMTYTSYYF